MISYWIVMIIYIIYIIERWDIMILSQEFLSEYLFKFWYLVAGLRPMLPVAQAAMSPVEHPTPRRFGKRRSSQLSGWFFSFVVKDFGKARVWIFYVRIYIYCYLFPIIVREYYINTYTYCLAKTWSFKRSLLSQLIFPINTCGHPR